MLKRGLGNRLSFFIMVLFVLTFSPMVFAQYPSLSGADSFEITVDNDGSQETFTIIRDGNIDDQMYYVPIRPTVAYETVKGVKEPIFSLVYWQTKNSKNEEVAGGMLQVSSVLGVSQETQKKMVTEIQNHTRLRTPKLSPLPISTATISLYSLSGDLISTAPEAPGVAPLFGTQHVPFNVNLKDVGVDAMKVLTGGAPGKGGKGGLPVLMAFSYSGITPKGGFKITVKWDNVYEHFSTDTKLQAAVEQASWGVNAAADFQTIRDTLMADGSLKVESLTNEAVSNADLEKYMDPVLKTLTDELVANLRPPATINPAVAKDLSLPESKNDNSGTKDANAGKKEDKKDDEKKDDEKKDDEKKDDSSKSITEPIKALEGLAKAVQQDKLPTKVFTGAISFSLKDAKYRKKGTIEYKFEKRAVLTRTTSCGGFLGIGNYPDSVKQKCITMVPPNQWEKGLLILPEIGNPDALGITSVDMTVIPQEKDASGKFVAIAQIPQQTAKFKKNGSGADAKWAWIAGKENKELNNMEFLVKYLYDEKNFEKNRDSYRYEITTVISKPLPNKSLSFTSDIPMFKGQTPLAGLDDMVDVFQADASMVDFANVDKDNISLQLNFTAPAFKDGKATLTAKLNNATNSASFLIPRQITSVTSTIQLNTKDTGILKCKYNSAKDIRTAVGAGYTWNPLSLYTTDFSK
ncbi:MAG: hypothetical protein HQM08_21540 [Candidatus Riflebacteria bacterium]|nr:hypothetical protein [Candidatus Riflebacteria bacterium]